jgi:hypothetical protein
MMDRRVKLTEVARRLADAHGPAGRGVAYQRARAKLAEGNETEAAMWLEVVRLVAGIADPSASHPTAHAVIPFPVAGEACRLADEPVPGVVAASAASDRRLVRVLGLLALLGAVLGTATIAATSSTAPPNFVVASRPVTPPPAAAIAEAPPDAVIPVIDDRPTASEVVKEPIRNISMSAEPPRVMKRVATHKPVRKSSKPVRQRHERTLWERVASVFR